MTNLFHMRQTALGAFRAAIAAADPYEKTRQALDSRSQTIQAADKVHVIAAGKAAIPMLRAAVQSLKEINTGHMIGVTNYENIAEVPGAEIFGANHPLPDQAGLDAANTVETVAKLAKEGELVICLISGGASALLPAPVAGVSLEEKIQATNALLTCGADIKQINTVRKALSRLKGGGLARAIAPAQCLTLLVSDVPGDDFGTIASGPTWRETSSEPNAFQIIEQFGLTSSLPASVLQNCSIISNKHTGDASVEHVLIGSNALSLAEARDYLTDSGYDVEIVGDWLEGPAEELAARYAQYLANATKPKAAFISGGETSVNVSGGGAGGRNQHMALQFNLLAKHNEKREFVFLSGGTDGRDGPTDAAGGIVDNNTKNEAFKRNVVLQDYLSNHDSHHGLKAVDGLVVTGATGTNVADIQILLVG